MLTTNKTSRARLIGGAATAAVLMLAGLGLTASGTQAAASVRDRVETATGVDLTALSVAAPTRAELPVPPQASELPAPPAPPAPPATIPGERRDVTTTTTTVDGKTVKQIRIVRRDKDGKLTTENYDGPMLVDVPEIIEGKCPDKGPAKEMVLNEKKGDKRRIILCMNRIERAATEGAAVAANSAKVQRDAMQTAIAGLRSARAGIEGNTAMTPEQRAEALKGIDEAIVEVTEEMGTPN